VQAADLDADGRSDLVHFRPDSSVVVALAAPKLGEPSVEKPGVEEPGAEEPGQDGPQSWL
jgi:hypothetical protein